jgi:hypothetical protein
MRRPAHLFLSSCAVLLACGSAAAFVDEGMWLFNKPPMEQLAGHGFTPDAAWLEHVQKSCVRFSTGGSGSIVSARGLVLTNHHVARDVLNQLSTPERNLLEDGFLARTSDAELACPDLELLALWSIEDVSERVNAAGAGKPAAEAEAARRAEMAAVEGRPRRSPACTARWSRSTRARASTCTPTSATPTCAW